MVRIGPYEPLEELGRGAVGTVLRARDGAGREVALKVLRPGVVTARVRRRFLQEARAMARVRHPNVVGIVDVGETPVPYIAMDLIRGQTLAARLAHHGRMPAHEAARVAELLALAVAEVHAAGLVHRDINTRNVLLREPGGEPVLTDLGLVGELDPSGSVTRMSVEGRFLGTPGFWPPEQARGALDEIGPASDVYSLGATLYAMLTGEPPFVVDTLEDALRVLEEDPRPPSTLRPDLDPTLEAVVMRCLARRPQDRYASAAALASALHAPRRRRGARSTSRRRGRRALVFGVVVSALLAAIASGLDLMAPPAPPATVSVPAAALAPAPPPPTAPAVETTPPTAPPTAPPTPPAPTTPPPLDPSTRVALEAELRLARERLARGDVDGAAPAVDRALSLSPDHPEALIYQSMIFSNRGDRARALATLDRAVAVAPEQPRPIAMRGLMRQEEGDLQGAVADLTRSLELDAAQPLAWHNRACAFLALRDPAAALADEERAIALDPAHAPAYYIRARAHQDLGELQEAEDHAGQAVTRRPSYAAAWLLRAELRARRGDRDGALADARQAVATSAAGSRTRADADRLRVELETAGAR